MRWLTKAAEKGNPAAAAILGSVYQQGVGTPVDYGKAVLWFQKGADAGVPFRRASEAGDQRRGGANHPRGGR